SGPTTYRVFLMPGALQFDLSLTPAAAFRPAGPRFRLLFGASAPEPPEAAPPRPLGALSIPTPAVVEDVFGWGVIYALHARACIVRGRPWQAVHYVGAVRVHALSLACFRLGVVAVQARGYDDLPAEVLGRLEHARVPALEPQALRRALAPGVTALLQEGIDASLPHAELVAERLAPLTSAG